MIFTFYSYKGGVGRSMALANIAELYYQKGKNVLIIDWDLEAPGLENFFEISKEIEFNTIPGLFHLMQSYEKFGEISDLSKYLIDLHPSEKNSNYLWMIYSGKRANNEKDYINFIRGFYWDRNITISFGSKLKKILNNQAEIVLIDSRTGYSDINGISTYNLLDMLVCFCSCSKQSIEGLKTILDHITAINDHELEKNKHNYQKIPAIVIPSRFDHQRLEKSNELDEFAYDFYMTFQPYMSHVNLTDSKSISKDQSLMWKIGIPYDPNYSYKEKLAATDKNETVKINLCKAYENIIQLMNYSRYSFSTLLFYDDRDKVFCDQLKNEIEINGLKFCTHNTPVKKGEFESKVFEQNLSNAQYITIVWSHNFCEKKENFSITEQEIWNKAGNGIQALVIKLDTCELPEILKKQEDNIFDYSTSENSQKAYINKLKGIIK